MPDGEVKIHIVADGDSKKIEDMQKRIADLRRAADAYDKNYKVDMGGAAQSARSEAAGLEREVFRMSKMRAAAEKGVTQEIKEQGAMRKAGIGARGVSRAVGVGEQVLSGGNPASSASSLLVQGAATSGNPALIAGAVAAAIATTIASQVAKAADLETSQNLQKESRVKMTEFNLNRQSGVHGSSAGLMNTALEAEEEVASRRANRENLVQKAKVKFSDPSTWKRLLGSTYKTDGEIELQESDAKSAEAQKRMVEAKNKAKERWVQTEGGLELDVLRQRSKRTLEGSRKAFVSEEAGKAFAKYNEARAQGADPKMAEEMATLTYQNDLRDRQANAGAGLVDSRSGGAGIAAAARWAMQGTPQESDIKAEVGRLIGVVQDGNQTSLMEKHSK